MIDYIKGILTELNPTWAVIETAGVGYSIAITLPGYSSLVGKEVESRKSKDQRNDVLIRSQSELNDGLMKVESRKSKDQRNDVLIRSQSELNDGLMKVESGEEVKLYVTEVIREDAHELYGFVNKSERQLFELLMTVSGVGAATARMIMSAFSAEELRTLIATGNSKAMAKVKGLGPKTAQRIIVDLKDKAIKLDFGGDPTEIPMLDVETDNGVKVEAVSALTMLGFAAAASGKAVDKILKNDPTLKVEGVIREALKTL